MRIKCIANLGTKLPESVLKVGYTFETVFHLTIDQDYDVFGISVYRGAVLYLLLDDVELPNWYPAELFSIVDPTVNDQWIAGHYPANELGLTFIIGYHSLVADEHHYDDLIERVPEALRIFHQHVREG